jgi:hypothetical protein
MNLTFSRFAYRLILRSHPSSFQGRFGGEMLWIFEEECRRGATARLLLDGILSLLRQRLSAQNEPDEPIYGAASSAVLVSDQKISAVRFLQGGFASLLLFTGLALALERKGPLPVPFELRAQKCIPCSGYPKAAPLQIEVLRNTAR